MLIQRRKTPRVQMSFRQPGRARIAVVVALVVAVGLVAVTGLALISTGSDRSLTLTFYRPSPADGSIPDGEEPSVFDQESPAVNRLDPDLLTALRASASEAHRDGVDVVVNSGWRSRKFQQWLLDRATDRYGSRAEARRWVDTPVVPSTCWEGGGHRSGRRGRVVRRKRLA